MMSKDATGFTTHHSSGSSSNQFRTVLRSFAIWGVIALRYLGRFNVSNSTCFAGNATLSSEEWSGGCRWGIDVVGKRESLDLPVSVIRTAVSRMNIYNVGRSVSTLLKASQGRWCWPRCGRPVKTRNIVSINVITRQLLDMRWRRIILGVTCTTIQKKIH